MRRRSGHTHPMRARRATARFALPWCLIVAAPQLLAGQATSGPTSAAPRSTATLQPPAFVTDTLSPGAEHVYSVALTRGQYLHVGLEGIAADRPVTVRIRAPDGTLVGSVFTYQREAGAPTYTLLTEQSGEHRLVLEGAPEAAYALRLRLADAQEGARERETLAAATTWLRTNAHPLRSTEARTAFDDLLPLREILRGVRVTAIGEATHGSREFRQVTHRLLEFLVTQMGYTHFGLEASQDAGRALDEYVRTGRGDRSALLRNQRFWLWDTEEVAALIDWMRDYNRSVPEARHVRFFGFDFQINPTARERIVSYLRTVAPHRAPGADSLLIVLTEAADTLRPDFIRYYALEMESKRPLVRDIDELRGYLEVNRMRFAGLTGAAALEEVIRSVELVQQFAHTHATPGYALDSAATGLVIRDRYMAENVLRLLSQLPPDARVVLSMHNNHSRRDPHLYSTGHFLAAALGDEYYVFNTSFHHGGFTALNLSERPLTPQPLSLGPAFPQSIGWFMRHAGKGDLYVDFRRQPDTGPAAEWLRRSRRMRAIGGGHPPWEPGYYAFPVVPGVSFDGLLFVERTTPTRLNPGARR